MGTALARYMALPLAAGLISCATPPPATVELRVTEPTEPVETKNPPAQSAPIAVPAPAMVAPTIEPEHTEPAFLSTARRLATLRVEAGALVTQVNGDRQLSCTKPGCDITLPPGTHRFTVGYKDTETRAGSRVTFASMHSREIEVTLEPGHTYSLTASGRYTPKWWIAVQDETANKVVYNDREKPE